MRRPPSIRPCLRLLLRTALGCVLVLAPATGVQAQFDRPGDTRPELPDFAPPEVKRGNILPPVPLSEQEDTEALSGGAAVFVREYRVTGGSVFSAEELAQLTDPYTNREVSYGELEALRDRITLAYVERGYVTSGAVVPSQTITDGVVEIQLVEGVLAAIDVNTDGRYRTKALQRQLIEPGELVNVNTLETRLQLLQQDERIRSVQARLQPSETLGESVLEVDVLEGRPYAFGIGADNYESPAVGGERVVADAAYLNLRGEGDTVRASFDATEGLIEWDASYETPLGPFGTMFELHASNTDSEVTEKPFDDLDIKSRSWTYGATLRQSLHRTLETDFSLFLTGELRRSKSFLLGSGFSFSPGPEEGVSRISALRFGADWSRRTRQQVLVLRSQLSWGLDAFGATTQGSDTADGQFLAWLGQAQWARRVPLLNTLLILRGDVQLSTDALLGLEQFAVGGHSSVRGYRENALVRDNGVLGSLEARVPVLRRADGTAWLEVGPFIDYGRSWNQDRTTNGPKSLWGAGVALRASITRYLKLEASWAEDLRKLDRDTDWDLQDEGIQFRIRMELP